jgi:uncharacterized protein (TIGR02266 family)
MVSRTRLTPATARMVQEFLILNRRRLRENPPLSPHEKQRWTELRWGIEEAVGGSAPGDGTRRKALRVRADLKVECSDTTSTELGSAEEIAEGGLFLVTERPSAVGTPLCLRLIGDAGEVVEVEGAVVWVRSTRSDRGPPGMGIEFVNLEPSQREAVAYLVQEALAAL